MPTRTEIVITIGEVLDCLPPGKAFKRRRYNSFDANTVGNEENLAPGLSGVPIMKPVKLEAEDDDEVSFRTCNGDSLAEGSRSKPKRKTSAEKFLEDNANYFQLEVLSSKTRSNKRISDNGDFGEDDVSKEGFHNSFLDFLKSKGVEKETVGRSRHKSAESELGREGREGRSRTVIGRSHSSHSPYHRSRSTNRELNGHSKSRGRSRSKSKVCPPEDQSASESESDTKTNAAPLLRRGRRAREVSPSGSEAESVSSRPTSRRSRRGKAVESEASSDEESKSRASSPLNKPSPRKKRSELDKLLEAVDTSFHFETAAAERKRLNDSGLGPLEIDCSDTGSEASCNVVSKRKASECQLDPEEVKIKKQKVGNNLLKTASPVGDSTVKSEAPSCSGSESEFDGSGSAWDGWDLLADQLQSITHSPVEIDRLHFSFETEPAWEGWYSTYQRQDKGDEIVFYPTSTTAPFLLPYELPYASFLPGKSGDKSRRDETPLGSRPQSKATSPVRQPAPSTSSTSSTRKAKSRKVSECDSTDSEDLRRGRCGRGGSAKGKPPPIVFPAHLQEPNYRVSPRQHASTKSFLTGSEADGAPGELEDLAEAYIMRDEAELHFPNLTSYLGAEDSNDSYSSESVKSRSVQIRGPDRADNFGEMSLLAATIDKIMLGDLAIPSSATEESSSAAKIPPTRSRVSSDQLLSPKKIKKKKKLQSESVSPLDQHVADSVDPVLLDCLEDELPTVPLDELSEPMEMLDTYTRCTSMAVCNKRWLKPSKMDPVITPVAVIQPVVSPVKPKRKFIYKDDLPGFSIDSDMEAEKLPVSKRRPKEEPKEESRVKAVDKVEKDVAESEDEEQIKPKKRGPSPSKKIADPSKPKRIIIYKDDLPGFEVLPDSDVESEKMPVSSRRGSKPGPKPGKKKFKVAKSVKEVAEAEDDEDTVSVESFSSTSSGPKKKRKMNRTGFPSPKKKKVAIKQELDSLGSPKVKLNKNAVKDNLKSPKGVVKTSNTNNSLIKSTKPDTETAKRKVPKQVKLDRFITKSSKTKSNPSESSTSKSMEELANSRRSATLKTKNYSELESDTESLLEMPLGVPGTLASTLPKKLKVDLGPVKTVKKK